jgi:hypothetical protein
MAVHLKRGVVKQHAAAVCLADAGNREHLAQHVARRAQPEQADLKTDLEYKGGLQTDGIVVVCY